MATRTLVHKGRKYISESYVKQNILNIGYSYEQFINYVERESIDKVTIRGERFFDTDIKKIIRYLTENHSK